MDIKKPVARKLVDPGNGSNLAAKTGNFFIGKSNLILTVCLVVLFVSVVSCFVLWGYEVRLNREIESLSAEISALQSKRNIELEENFTFLKSGIEILKQLFNKRIYPSLLFGMVEELTLPQVRFTSADIDFKLGLLSLQTEALDYSTLAKQAFIFSEDERIKKAEFSTVSLDTSGRVTSEISLELDSNFLHP